MPNSLLELLKQEDPDDLDTHFEHLQQLTAMQPLDSMEAVWRLVYMPPVPPRDSGLEHALVLEQLEVLREKGPKFVLDAYEQWQQEKAPL